MQLYPAIDLKDGKCVRLKQGEFDNMTVYSDEPYKVARYFEENGATFIHLVDLDGALKGHSVNEETIKKIVGSVTVPCELGGGIRTMEDIERVLSYGIYRVIIGTKAVKEPEFVRKAIERFGSDHIVAGVDARDGMVAIEGWGEVSGTSAVSLCNAMKEMGVRHIVYTDISKDGMLCGPNVEMTKKRFALRFFSSVATSIILSPEEIISSIINTSLPSTEEPRNSCAMIGLRPLTMRL